MGYAEGGAGEKRFMMKSAGWYTLDEREVGSAVVRVKAVPGVGGRRSRGCWGIG